MKQALSKGIQLFKKKFLPLIIGLSILLFLIIKSGLPHEMLRSYIQFQFKHIYKLPITITKIEGSIINNITLKDIAIHTPEKKQPLISIPELQFSYPPHHLLNKKLRPKIFSNISITNPKIFINRFKDGSWNFQSLTDYSKKNKPNITENTHYNSTIKVNNLTIHYTDEKKFGFNTTITSLNGTVQLTELNQLSTTLSGTIQTYQTPVTINATGNPLKKHYNITTEIANLNIHKWGPYILPIKGYSILTGSINAKVNIRSKSQLINTPYFLFDIILTAKNSTMKLPFFKFPAKNIEGRIHIYQGTIAPSLLHYTYPKITPSQSMQVLHTLKKSHLIDHNNTLSHSINSFPPQTKWIQTLLQSPPMIISFDSLSGTLKNQQTTLNGVLDITQKKIKLVSHTELSDFSKLNNFTALSLKHTASGTSTIKLYFNNKLKKPTITGKLQSHVLYFKTIPIYNPLIHYTLDNTRILLEIQNGTLYTGTLSGKGEVTYRESPPQLNATITATNIKIPPIKKNIAPIIGTTNLQLTISGNATHLTGTLNTSSSNISIYAQPLHQLNTTFKILPDYSQLNALFYFNQNTLPLTLTGSQTPSNTTLKIIAAHLPLKDIDPHSINTKKGKLTTQITINIPKKSQKKNKKNVQITGNITIKEFPFYGQQFKSLSTTFHHHNNQTIIDTFTLTGKENKNNITFKGSFKNTQKSVVLSVNKFNIGTSKLIERYIPTLFKPFGGIADIKLSLNSPTPFSKKSPQTPYEWLSNYTISGTIRIKDLLIQNQSFNTATIQGKWNGKIGKFDTISLSHINTSLKLTGALSNTGSLNFKIKDQSTIDIENLKTLFKPWGAFSGKLYINGTITNTIHTPRFAIKFNAYNIHSPSIQLDHLSGNIDHKKQSTKIHSIVIKQNKSKLKLNGTIKYTDPKNILETLSVTLKTELSQLDLTLFKQLLNNISLSQLPTFNIPNNIRLTSFKDRQTTPLYTSSINTKSIVLYHASHYTKPITRFNQISRPPHKKATSFGLLNSLKGKLSGKFTLTKSKDTPLFINANLSIKNGSLGSFRFSNSQLIISQIKNNHSFTISLLNGALNQNPFNSLFFKGSLANNTVLKIESMTFNSFKKNTPSMIKGTIPISELWLPSKNSKSKISKPLSITLNIVDDQINILSLLHPKIKTISNKGHILLSITGTLDHPIITAPKLNLNHTKLTLKKLNSPLLISSSNISINQNKIIIQNSILHWKTKLKQNRYHDNTLQLNGLSEFKKTELFNSH